MLGVCGNRMLWDQSGARNKPCHSTYSLFFIPYSFPYSLFPYSFLMPYFLLLIPYSLFLIPPHFHLPIIRGGERNHPRAVSSSPLSKIAKN